MAESKKLTHAWFCKERLQYNDEHYDILSTIKNGAFVLVPECDKGKETVTVELTEDFGEGARHGDTVVLSCAYLRYTNPQTRILSQ